MRPSSSSRFSAPLLALLAAIALGGCKDKPAADGDKGEAKAQKSEKDSKKGAEVASCNLVSQESLCREYGSANIEAAGEDDLKKLCDGMKGAFKKEACPKEKRIGACATPEGTKVFYDDGPLPLTVDQAKKQCKEGQPAGEWKS